MKKTYQALLIMAKEISDWLPRGIQSMGGRMISEQHSHALFRMVPHPRTLRKAREQIKYMVADGRLSDRSGNIFTVTLCGGHKQLLYGLIKISYIISSNHVGHQNLRLLLMNYYYAASSRHHVRTFL
jgi:hypothetical protein